MDLVPEMSGLSSCKYILIQESNVSRSYALFNKNLPSYCSISAFPSSIILNFYCPQQLREYLIKPYTTASNSFNHWRISYSSDGEEYFEVDEQEIESNLITDYTLVLDEVIDNVSFIKIEFLGSALSNTTARCYEIYFYGEQQSNKIELYMLSYIYGQIDNLLSYIQNP